MVGTKKSSEKTKNVVKAKPSPSVATAPEPALPKSFPTSSREHAVETQSPPTTPSKEKPDGIIAYVHDLSSTIQNKRKTMKYSTLTLQTESKDLHALLYSPQKRPLLEDSLRTRTPVKIRRFTRTADQAKLHYQWYDRHFSTLTNWVLLPVCRSVNQQVHRNSRYPPQFKRRWFSDGPWQGRKHRWNINGSPGQTNSTNGWRDNPAQI